MFSDTLILKIKIGCLYDFLGAGFEGGFLTPQQLLPIGFFVTTYQIDF